MNILHILILLSAGLLISIQLFDNRLLKLTSRLLFAISSYLIGISVFFGNNWIIALGDFDLSEYLPLHIDVFNWLCYLVTVVIMVNTYTKSFNNKEYDRDFKLPYDLILFSCLVITLTDSFFIYSIILELIVLYTAPALVETENKESIIKRYQIIFSPSLIAMGVYAIYYSSNNELSSLLNFSFDNILNMRAGLQSLSGSYTAFFLLIYFTVRWLILFKIVFKAIRVKRQAINLIPMFSVLFILGYINYMKKVLDMYPIFSSNIVIIILLLTLTLMSINDNEENPGMELIKKSFQLIILLVISTMMKFITIGPSFFTACSIMLTVLLFLSIRYYENKSLSILNELKKEGKKNVIIIIALALIILTLSPTPLTPIVFSLFENIKQIFLYEKIVSILMMVVFCTITFPLMFKIRYFEGQPVVSGGLGASIGPLIFLLSYLVLCFGIIGFSV